MKVALCQMSIVWENKKQNIDKMKFFIKEAASESIDLILFPEMTLTGFSMNIKVTKETDDNNLRLLEHCAKEFNIAIGFGWVKDIGDKAENHYMVINKNGKQLSDYAKIHPFSNGKEDIYFKGGQEIITFELSGIKFSTFICYDLRFPEIFQAISDNTDVIIIAANWPERRNEHWRCLLQARAIENQVYILGVNCVGEIGSIKYSGDSMYINPWGEILAQTEVKEELLFCDIQDNVASVRKEFNFRKDRKIGLYRKFYDMI